MKDPSLVNIIKGKMGQILNPYKHYQNLKLQKMKEVMKLGSSREARIYNVVS